MTDYDKGYWHGIAIAGLAATVTFAFFTCPKEADAAHKKCLGTKNCALSLSINGTITPVQIASINQELVHPEFNDIWRITVAYNSVNTAISAVVYEERYMVIGKLSDVYVAISEQGVNFTHGNLAIVMHWEEQAAQDMLAVINMPPSMWVSYIDFLGKGR